MRKIFTLLIVAILATATSWAAEKTILLQNIGESASATSTESVSQVTVKASGTSDSYTLNYLQGRKQGSAILLPKSTGAFISNKTPIPGEIKSIKVYINKGASGKTTYYCAFTSSECLKAYNQGCTAVKIAGGQNHTFTNTTVGATYFCISLGNTNNGQVLSVEITYNEGSPEPQKTVKSLAISGEPAKVAYETGESFNPEGLTVTATYDDKSTADVTADATWTFDPAVFNTTGSVTVTALAAYGGKDDIAEYTVTVSAKPLKLTITPATGTYTSAQTVTIEANNAVGNVAIYYTTDGSNPEEGANEYTAPFEVATTTTVKAYAIDDELREATAESVITIKASTFAAENFNGCITQGGRDGNFKIGSGDISDDNFDCGGWVYDATVYAANSCVKVGSSKTKGSLTSPVVASTNYNMISFDIAGWESGTNTISVTINNGGTFADGTTSKSFTATNAKWTTVTEKITGLTPTTTFTFKGKRLFLDSIILMNASTLANLAVNGTEGKEYTVNDEMVVTAKFQAGDKNYIVVKDAAQAVRNLSAPTADDKFFNINGNKQQDYTQNNWMIVSLPTDLYNQVNEKSIITSITGSLAEKFNLAMEATNVEAGEATDFVPNTYCPINFMGASSVKGENSTSTYYFATPKANEYAKVVWAVYDATDGIFCIPAHEGGINGQGFKAAFRVNYSLNTNAAPVLADGRMYEFDALVKETAPTKVAPRKIGYDSTVEPKAKYVVYPLNLEAGNVSTGVNDVNSAKEVKGVSYFNMMGVESAQPFDGVNIMVTTYTDGTQSATKVLR